MSQDRFPAAPKRSSEKIISNLDEMLKINACKTPIQVLHEFGTKTGKAPVYTLEKAEGQAHQPSFTFQVAIGEIVCTGEGASKKIAKHKAAESALNILRGDNSKCLPITETPIRDVSKVPLNQMQSNPVGSLQELAVQKGWRLPEYTLAQESGPPHKREYTITCRVETFVETGSGSSKKVAKRVAAEKLMNRFETIPTDINISMVSSSL
ncbi:hypothetical protein GDO86_000845 [Hymenochirus boettgeri]|uniref:DRBM domain-containing protein n=2 Tax=Hymenochirus boettgeri TaxID=247094 RepID=A0A8T2IET8_9PIPI|nr:hypothetical protein GDO86_020415 [Hymenochirus boettgeri]KAG8454372.1 hypothetical protein GDO86_000845 [Hymenochirus boettgeri]